MLRSRAAGRGGFLLLPFILLVLLGGKISAGRRPLLRCTRRVRRKGSSRSEQTCTDKADARQIDFVHHSKSSLSRFIGRLRPAITKTERRIARHCRLKFHAGDQGALMYINYVPCLTLLHCHIGLRADDLVTWIENFAKQKVLNFCGCASGNAPKS
jgi:hypothetical protein